MIHEKHLETSLGTFIELSKLLNDVSGNFRSELSFKGTNY